MANWTNIVEKICTPPVLVEKESFLIKIAENEQEIAAAKKLRFDVFALEQGRLDTGLGDTDSDEFDDFCQHMIVVEKSSGKVVGTYRTHPGVVAKECIGFYSAREFTIEGIEHIAEGAIEVGRSCVAPEHRNGTVVALLWAGFAEFMRRTGMRYMFGCVSLENPDPAVGWALYEYFRANGKISTTIKASPNPGFELPAGDADRIRELQAAPDQLLREIPPLFKGYLRLGVMVCGEPVWDDGFKSIDFMILLDLATIHDKYKRHFGYVGFQEKA